MKQYPLLEMLYLFVRFGVLCILMQISDAAVMMYHEEYPVMTLVGTILTVVIIFFYGRSMLRVALDVNEKYFK